MNHVINDPTPEPLIEKQSFHFDDIMANGGQIPFYFQVIQSCANNNTLESAVCIKTTRLSKFLIISNTLWSSDS